ncbi:hypothetical protein [Plebeiibacterium marinum]|nr:hypothetical protein [Plebeiobacterium marinum]
MIIIIKLKHYKNYRQLFNLINNTVNMKKGLFLSFLLVLASSIMLPGQANSQEEKVETCEGLIQAPFISNGQPFRAFLTGDEVAEFHTTFLNGSMYRVVACSGKNEPIIFSIYDTNRNLLFSNDEHNKSNVWDFKIDGSVECIIEARLDKKITTSGMALLYIGFKNLEGN